MLKYCVRCVMPDTKPDLSSRRRGVCSACRSYEGGGSRLGHAPEGAPRSSRKYRRHGSNWDCIVPVSGGKDSTYQVIRMLQLGLNPLASPRRPATCRSIGRDNIENLKHLGVDHVGSRPNPSSGPKLNRIGLTEVGDISWPEHVGIFTIPVRMAVQFGVPLIVWGENSQNEYGGPAAPRRTTC